MRKQSEKELQFVIKCLSLDTTHDHVSPYCGRDKKRALKIAKDKQDAKGYNRLLEAYTIDIKYWSDDFGEGHLFLEHREQLAGFAYDGQIVDLDNKALIVIDNDKSQGVDKIFLSALKDLILKSQKTNSPLHNMTKQEEDAFFNADADTNKHGKDMLERKSINVAISELTEEQKKDILKSAKVARNKVRAKIKAGTLSEVPKWINDFFDEDLEK